MKRIALFFALVSLVFATQTIAMEGHGSADKGAASEEHGTMEGMDHGSESKDGTFTHTAMVDGMHTEFKVMDLASMNMKDPEGKTHHVMVTFMRDNAKVMKAVGKIKLVSPSGKEQLAEMKDFGGGVFAANFTIDEPGKWGVICLFKEAEGKHTVKFWYDHMAM
ncbi:hypothetical protein [Desulfosediminicola flagellatus]|uniref:hypothetical protein n=1 Tax=Desulfosediminicola flagellatus TaxID=2569541 RepID=UPI0010AC292C|nr:hypothetical protein [Desulfosediminicola flagellatus]